MDRRSFLLSAPAVLTPAISFGGAEMTNPMPSGRSAWTCTGPVIYPGWWSFKHTGVVGGIGTIDGTRTMAPAVVKVGNTFRLYYLAERDTAPYGTKATILQCTAPVSDPTNFTPKGIALEFPTSQKVSPAAGDDPEAYYAAGPYHTTVLPWLTPDGSAPGKDANGNFYPWWMYLASKGSNTAVARSLDGGETFQLVSGNNPLFPFECITVNGVMRRTPVLSKSKPYDYGGCGSACVVRDNAGKFHMFYTAAAALTLTYDDLGGTGAEIGHVSGGITDIGIGYAESTDGLTFTRRTAQALGVTSPAARGSGRIIDPRRRDNPNGLLEYIVSRPMVFRDGPLWRMLVSSHSKTYRSRSLHSTDLVNWTWDDSPADGMLGLGGVGAFDELHAAYPCGIRVGNTYHVWYTGNRYGHVAAGVTGIGYATATAL